MPARSKSLSKINKEEIQLNSQTENPIIEWYEPILDGGYIPDFLLRPMIRQLLSMRKSVVDASTQAEINDNKLCFVKGLKASKVAINTKEANQQHYEVPSEFIQLCLGKRMKYSCCLFPTSADGKRVLYNGGLDEAENAMLESYCKKAQLVDGQTILDLGCGWGSLSLFLAEKYPRSKITGVSNSKTQKVFIDSVAKEKGFKNLTILTADANTLELGQKFDRIISIEMLEHMKNYDQLFKRISTWMKDDALFFVHIFSHKNWPYHFKVDERHSWMARNFFTGGTMPSHDLFLYFQDSIALVDQWVVNGMHYSYTSEEWLRIMDQNKPEAMKILKQSQIEHLTQLKEGKSQEEIEKLAQEEAHKWFTRWRIFYISVAELFGYNNGEEWFVSHYLFKKK